MEPVLHLLKILAALSLALFGAYALLAPKGAAGMIHADLRDSRGVAETRVNFGGFFVGMGVMAILLNVPASYQVAGAAYVAAAAARALGYVLDRPPLDAQYAGLFAFELAAGVVLLI